jgi:hypothetical protein
MKAKRGDIKRFREFLNEQSISAPKHRHNRFHQASRQYGDYLYHQDREKFMVEMAEWLETGTHMQ